MTRSYSVERTVNGLRWPAMTLIAVMLASMTLQALDVGGTFPRVREGSAGDDPVFHVSDTARPVAEAAVRLALRPLRLRDAVWAAGSRLASVPDDDERCLAQAVYFEARSEPLAGQLAVAQVVLNRVRSPWWPDSVCAVVFQNERWRHRCQFSFACDGLSDRPREMRAWRIARMVARTALDHGWPDITLHATHYHADYVRPAWQTQMVETARFGRHLFYRDARLAARSVEDFPADNRHHQGRAREAGGDTAS
ncbi:MAG: cell wall hydrolase [Alphaproteobacteria bacterium]|nr:MAG: cell wall hydrolase [Alphaproteobacteria bacterium]